MNIPEGFMKERKKKKKTSEGIVDKVLKKANHPTEKEGERSSGVFLLLLFEDQSEASKNGSRV